MDEVLTRVYNDLLGRMHGPLTFRLILQPLMATFFAVRDGIHDARDGKPAYFWSFFSCPERWKEQLLCGWRSVGRVFIFAVAMDFVYQIIALHWFYPGEAVILAIIVALIPYIVLRGPVNRLARHWLGGRGGRVASRPI